MWSIFTNTYLLDHEIITKFPLIFFIKPILTWSIELNSLKGFRCPIIRIYLIKCSYASARHKKYKQNLVTPLTFQRCSSSADLHPRQKDLVYTITCADSPLSQLLWSDLLNVVTLIYTRDRMMCDKYIASRFI